MEVRPPEKVGDNLRLLAIVNAVEDVACCLNSQCGEYRAFAVSGNGCGAGSNTKAYRLELTQFLHYGTDLPSIRSLCVENGFRAIENYKHLL